MKGFWRSEWPHLLLLVLMFATAAASWASAPDRIPVHWGMGGQVDRYGGKFEGLLAIPLLALGIYLIMRYLPRIDPARANYAGFASAYATLRLSILVLMAALYGVTQLWIHGHPLAVNIVVPLLVGALFVVVGSLLGRIRPNWFVGLRTPWTLSSERAWTRTHRAGGRLFVALGLLFMAFAAFQRAWLIWVLLALGGIGALGLVAYSYVLWSGDPDRTPPSRTLPR